MCPRRVLLLNFAMLYHTILIFFPGLSEQCSSFQTATYLEIQILEAWDYFFFLRAKIFNGGE